MIAFGIREVVVSDRTLVESPVDGQQTTDNVIAATVRQLGALHCLVMLGSGEESQSVEVWRENELALLCPESDSRDESRPCFVFDLEALPVAVLGWLSPVLSTLSYSPNGGAQDESVATPDAAPDWWVRYVATDQPMVGVESFGGDLVWTQQATREAPEHRSRVGSSEMIDRLVGAMVAGLVGTECN